MHRERTIPLLALAILFGTLAAAATAPPPHTSYGPGGEPLPFAGPGQAVDFLAGAEILEVIDLSEGITKPKKLLLEHEGVRAHAIFHSIDRREQKAKTLENGRRTLYLVDSYRSQVAAWELSQMLGIDCVPPTVERTVRGRSGSVQLWIENAMTEEGRRKRGLDAPDTIDWNHQKADQWVFDNLINNIDRNTGNSLIDADWNLWLIDHSRSFGRDRKLPYPERISYLSKELWQGLLTLDSERVHERLAPYLDKAEIKALLQRRRLLVDAIEARIARLGEKRVVRERGKPWMAVTYSEDP